MPPLDLLGGVSGLRERAANATEAGKQQAKGQERAASEEESTPKRQRTSEPLPRNLKRALGKIDKIKRFNSFEEATRAAEAEGKTQRRAESSASDSDDRLSGLDNRQKRKVQGRNMSAAERELARHSTVTKEAEAARIGRQEDMRYALDTFRQTDNKASD